MSMAEGGGVVEAATRAVEACHVLVAVIGPRWLTVADRQADGLTTFIPHL